MSESTIYSISNDGSLKNVSRDFRYGESETVEKCLALLLDGVRRYEFLVPKLGSTKRVGGDYVYEWDFNKVVVFAPPTPAAHESVLRLLRIGLADKLEGYVFSLFHLGKLVCICDSREALERVVCEYEEDLVEDLFIRIVPLNVEV